MSIRVWSGNRVLGKKHARANSHLPQVVDYISGVLPTPPRSTAYRQRVSAYLTYFNAPDITDPTAPVLGCCVAASKGHLYQNFNPTLPPIPAASIMSFYETQGYVPGDPSTDEGMDMQQANTTMITTGLQKADGTYDKWLASPVVAHRNIPLVQNCINWFQGVDIGLQLPESAEDQSVWTIVSGSPIAGGHDVCLVDFDQDYLYAVSWGAIYPMTYQFFLQCCDEAFAPLSSDIVTASGITQAGLDMQQLLADQVLVQKLSS